jgi:hypothetical protein
MGDASRLRDEIGFYSGLLFLRSKDHSLQPTMAPMINTITKAARDSKFIAAFDPKNDRAARVETIRRPSSYKMDFGLVMKFVGLILPDEWTISRPCKAATQSAP